MKGPKRFTVNMEINFDAEVEARTPAEAIRKAFEGFGEKLKGVKVKRWWWNRAEEVKNDGKK